MKILLFFLFPLLSISITANSQTAILHPIKDNTIYSESNSLSNARGDGFFVGRTGANAGFAKRRALIQFDLSSIPSGAILTNVTLKVNVLIVPPTGDAVPNLIGLRKCLQSWGEGTSLGSGGGIAASAGDATWSCRFANGSGGCTQSWNTLGGDFATATSSSVSVNDFGTYTFPSTAALVSDVQSWVNTPLTNFGWMVTGDEVNPYSARGFRSKEYDPLATTLTISYTAAACSDNTWTGAISTAWENPGNWSCGTVPSSTTNVILNSGNIVLGSSQSVRSLISNPGVSLTVLPGFELKILH